MPVEHTRLSDRVVVMADYQRPTSDSVAIRGRVHVVLTGPNGAVKYDEWLNNLVTQVGDQMYGEQAANIAGAVARATGMQLGTGTTTPAKTGAGAAIVTLVASSLVTIGTPTTNAIAEVALVNQSLATQTAAPASATISRALLSPTVNKAAGDSLTIAWQHDLLGA
jgi:hypothetical protein